MCGIWTFIQLFSSQEKQNTISSEHLSKLFADFMNMKARGPDMTSFQTIKNVAIGFHRLAIMDPTFHANQPYILEDDERTIIFVCNGEIYNFKDLIKEHELPIYNNSDCMTIPRLYLKYVKHNTTGKNYLNNFVKLFKKEIKGEFAFNLFEFDKFQNLKEVISGRDYYGVRPLYIGIDNSSIMFSSEIKGMTSFNGEVNEFKPGNINQIHFNSLGTFDSTYDYNFKAVYDILPYEIKESDNIDELEKYFLKTVRESVINCIKRRLTADRPTGFLLSGGVDSSLVCGIATKLLNQPIRTFCCGMNGGTDLKYAKQVADHIGSFHTKVIFTPEEGLEKIRDVIKFTETFDTTSIRASIGQHIVCEYISKNTDIKVLLVGEGSDECCGSYATFWNAPNADLFHAGCVEYLGEIHYYDGRRVDRNVSDFGLEARLALLDPEFVETYHKIPKHMRHPKYKGIEKYWLRAAFKDDNLLPPNCLFRKKEAFSDGISSTEKSWFQIIQEHIETKVSDKEFNENKWGCQTKEAYYYKKIFCEIFGENRLNVIPHYWQPKFLSDGTVVDFNNKDFYIDPSARVLTSVYKNEDQEI
jgi:asparagine synthase (glutamine-hydrolysing)